MQCPKCGFNLDAFTTTCPRCARQGAASAKPAARPQPSSKATAQPAHSPAYLAVWGILLLIALGMIGFAGYRLLFMKKTPVATPPAAMSPATAPSNATAQPSSTAPAPRAVPGAEVASPQPLIPTIPDGGGNVVMNAPSHIRNTLGRSGVSTSGANDATAPSTTTDEGAETPQ